MPLGARQPVVGVAAAPRVFKPRFLFSLSVQSLLVLPAFLASLASGFAPSLATGLCSVPSLAAGFAVFAFSAAFVAASASANLRASSSARRCINSCFLRTSSACIAAKVAWRLASFSRIAIWSAPSKSARVIGPAGNLMVFGSSTAAISTTTASATTSMIGSGAASTISSTTGSGATTTIDSANTGCAINSSV